MHAVAQVTDGAALVDRFGQRRLFGGELLEDFIGAIEHRGLRQLVRFARAADLIRDRFEPFQARNVARLNNC